MEVLIIVGLLLLILILSILGGMGYFNKKDKKDILAESLPDYKEKFQIIEHLESNTGVLCDITNLHDKNKNLIHNILSFTAQNLPYIPPNGSSTYVINPNGFYSLFVPNQKINLDKNIVDTLDYCSQNSQYLLNSLNLIESKFSNVNYSHFIMKNLNPLSNIFNSLILSSTKENVDLNYLYLFNGLILSCVWSNLYPGLISYDKDTKIFHFDQSKIPPYNGGGGDTNKNIFDSLDNTNMKDLFLQGKILSLKFVGSIRDGSGNLKLNDSLKDKSIKNKLKDDETYIKIYNNDDPSNSCVDMNKMITDHIEPI